MDATTVKILTIPVGNTNYTDAAGKIINAAVKRESRYVCVSNVHMCMEAFDDEAFSEVVNGADLVVPDGVPLVWGMKGLGLQGATQVRGSDLLLKICKQAELRGIPIGLYGGTPDSLKDFTLFLNKKFPLLLIPFCCSPPFRPLTKQEDEEYIKSINSSRAQIVFVGIGCPKQERWMAGHKGKVHAVMIGVGAAFDFFSGRKKHAPYWMQRNGLEWLFRLCNDPRRLWRRYLTHNPRFMFYFGRQLLSHKLRK